MNKDLDLSGLSSAGGDMEMSRYLNSPSENTSFSASSPMSASCSFMDTPVRKVKTCEALDKSSDLLLGNRSTSEFCRKLDKNVDEFWAALQSHYNYLMDDGLIATCKEASGELSWDDEDIDESITWSFTEFIEQFDKLSAWLDSLHISVSEDSTASGTSSSVSQSEDIKSKMCLRTKFNDQSKKLGKRYPNMKDEILNRVVLLNNKWDTLEQVIIPGNDISDHDGLLKDVVSKVKCLRRWLQLLENKIQPLVLHPEWTLHYLKDKLAENKVLQKEIESYSKFISSVLKSFDKLCASPAEGQTVEEGNVKCRCKNVKRVAVNLERRWHCIWLRSLEWRYLLEELISKCNAGFVASDSNLELSFGLDEPLTKVPRLGSSNVSIDPARQCNNALQDSFMSDLDSTQTNILDDSCNTLENEETPNISSNSTDRGIMVGKTSISELKGATGQIGKLEIIQDVGYSSESSTYMSNDCDLGYSYRPSREVRHSSDAVCTIDESGLEVQKLMRSSSSEFYTMTSVVMEDPEEGVNLMNGKMVDSGICPNTLSEEESVKRMSSTPKTSTEKRFSMLAPRVKGRKNERVKEWLSYQEGDEKSQRPAVVDSSCDASGEYTSNDDVESDTSKDLNSSVVTCKHRSGSVGSNIDRQLANVSDVQNGDVSPGKSEVVMRKKKRRNRDRPWSVTELYQMSSQLDLSPFSISETALNDLSIASASLVEEKSNSSLNLPRNASSRLERGSSMTSETSTRKKNRSRRRKTDSSSEGISSANGSFHHSGAGSDSTSRISPSRHVWSSRSSRSPGNKTCSSSTDKSLSDVLANVIQSDSESGDERPSRSQATQSTYLLHTKDSMMQTEETSNFSDQVWDGYQDPPYWSEACSEFAVDDKTLKKLIEFGDDYKAFIGSQSDTVSILSSHSIKERESRQTSSRLKVQPKKLEFNSDSDSDMEDLQHVIQESIGQLEFSESMLKKHRDKQSLGISQSSLDYAELEATCQTNVKCLQVIKNHLDGSVPNLSESGLHYVQGVLQRWENLNEDALLLRNQQERITKLANRLKNYDEQLMDISSELKVQPVSKFEELCDWINRYQEGLNSLQEIKAGLLVVSSSIQRMLLVCNDLAAFLKKDFTCVYHTCEDLYERCSSQLTEMHKTRTRWQQFLGQYDRLRSRLVQLSQPAAPKRDLTCCMDEIKEELTWLRRHVSQESLSSDCDSGIGLWDGATDLLQDVERQLDSLVDRCNHHHDVGSSSPTLPSNDNDAAVTTRTDVNRRKSQSLRTFMWRVLKGAVPFQLAVVLLCCLAWLLEPRCCDFSNSYLTSMNAQLHYDRGPPPV